ncbi:DNA replication/repair protein RecF [Fervidibacillus halotolerans]|uniref:DNA replication and repair protein RecF n=1 Tax=Fervidibacillus halotolerans TaxID=2980027 RepID=A0A9E8RXY8_9BACI|nr:DNA replication/repair protein RecF [Fervidibacillus halotolerans]WAA12301.1 DNA replication/repair protein RecF [Fervidibacillus halotolerans]
MYIQKLHLNHFRNYEKLSLSFENTVNVILGENAQGKTNVMESIFVLAMAKSHRTTNDRELIQWDQDYAKIKGTVKKENTLLPMELVITKKGKKAKINHLEQNRLSQYVGHFNVVMFAPEDLNLVKGSPSIRRRFIDMEIGQVSQIYLHEMSQFHKVLQQRNKILKQMQRADSTLLEIYTEQLAVLATKISKKRFEYLHLLEKWAKEIHFSITRGVENLQIRYKPSVNVSEEDDLSKMINMYMDQFRKVQQKELERGVTLIGPHRDDIKFYVNDRNVQIYGSQGQKRTTALSVKLAEIELIFNETGEYPTLLLDDVLSELDTYRQSHLLNTIQGKVQTFVTTTSVEGIDHQMLKDARTFQVKNGKIDVDEHLR